MNHFNWYKYFNQDPEVFKNICLNLPKDDPYFLLSHIPSAWNASPKGHVEFAVWLVKKINPKIILELGVDYGYSTLIFALNSKGQVFGIDCFSSSIMGHRRESDFDFICKIRDILGIKNLHIIRSYFEDIAPIWQKPIDVLHIDGLHDYESCKKDFNNFFPKLTHNGVVLFHDTESYPDDVGKFFSEIDLYKFNFKNSNGLGVASRNYNLIEEIRNVWNDQGYRVGVNYES